MQKIKNTQKQKQRTLFVLLSISLVVLMCAGVLAENVVTTTEVVQSGAGTITETSIGQVTAVEGRIPAPDVEVSISRPRPIDNFVSISLYPSKQVTNDGTASYKVVVKDYHKGIDCPEGRVCPTLVAMKVYKYELSFKAREDGTEGNLETEIITLSGGASASIELKVKTENKGASSFSVSVLGEDGKGEASGVIVFFPDGVVVPPVGSFFNGQGFILNEDKSEGFITDLKLLKKGDSLTGKVRIGRRNFKVEGTVSDGDVKFELFSVNSKKEVGSFVGEILKLNNFILLKGELENFEGDIWDLTAIVKHGMIRPILLEKEEVVEAVSVNEVISIESSTAVSAGEVSEVVVSTGEIYIRPVEIRRKRILRVIPNPWGKKVVSIEVIKGNKIFKRTIGENEVETIEGYNVAVGSLESEEAIEFSVKKAE